MKDNFKKKIVIIVLFLITVIAGIICGVYLPNSKINDNIQQVQTELIKEIVVYILLIGSSNTSYI